MNKITLKGDDVSMPAAWSFYRGCGIYHEQDIESADCVDCDADYGIWRGLVDGGEIGDGVAAVHAVAGDALYDALHQAAHDLACSCGGRYGAREGDVVEIVCERFKGAKCFQDGSPDGEPCECESCVDADDDVEIHYCFSGGAEYDAGACAAALMLSRAIRSEVAGLERGEGFSDGSVLIAMRAASLAGGIFLSETIKGVPPNIVAAGVKRVYGETLSAGDARGLDAEAIDWESRFRVAMVTMASAISKALDGSPAAWLLRESECDGGCGCDCEEAA